MQLSGRVFIRCLWVISLSGSLHACDLLGPGASDGDDDADDDGDGWVSSGDSYDGPSGSGGGAPAMPGWSCSEQVSSCDCKLVNFAAPKRRCEKDWDCCLRISDSNCECSVSTSCEAEARSRPGSSVVPHCPPEWEELESACAIEDENCSPTYLRDAGKRGCCAGMVCKANAEAVSVCQLGSEDELEVAALCNKPEPSPALCEATIAVGGSLQFDAGELPFDLADMSLEVTQEGGLTDASIGLSLAGNRFCRLTAERGSSFWLGSGAIGYLTLYEVSLRLAADCAGFPSAAAGSYVGDMIDARLTFEGAQSACGAAYLGRHCFSGVFTLALDGSLIDDASEKQLVLSGAQVQLTGQICSESALYCR
jgi:hypothetical protein